MFAEIPHSIPLHVQCIEGKEKNKSALYNKSFEALLVYIAYATICSYDKAIDQCTNIFSIVISSIIDKITEGILNFLQRKMKQIC